MAALAEKLDTALDPFAAVRALNRMRRAGFVVRLADTDLQIAPIASLSDSQRAYLRIHKAALVGLLSDAETLHAALVLYGPAGLGWHQGTPADWDDARLLSAGEVLYSDGRMVSHYDRRYCSGSAPTVEEAPEYHPPAESPEIEANAAVMREAPRAMQHPRVFAPWIGRFF